MDSLLSWIFDLIEVVFVIRMSLCIQELLVMTTSGATSYTLPIASLLGF